MKIKSVIACFALLLGSLHAATINVGGVFSGTSGLQAVSANGTVLSSGGYYIAVGSYAGNIVPTLDPGNANLTNIVDAMRIFATLPSPTVAGNTQGTITGSFVSLGGTTPENFNGQQIFIVVGNGATRALSTDFAIITTATNILFPANVTTTATTAVTLSSITNSVAIIGSEFDNGGARDQILMVTAVPEPSVALLGLLGIAGLIRRRR